ncbi:MAG: hypothetical protein AB7D51_01260 [Desulfovibrionaceae bacterium]|jgi:hypothetical protein
MIVIDGQKSELKISDFSNLEEILTEVVENGHVSQRVVTDVLLNKEPFSEIYPHQAEDIEAREIQELEIRSVPVQQMASDIVQELYKVVKLMGGGGREVATLFRQADDAEALETYQDLLDVTRHFITMVGVIREEFSMQSHPEFKAATLELSALFTEMTEVLANEDWILLADLLEYEFLPAVAKWEKVVDLLREDVAAAA